MDESPVDESVVDQPDGNSRSQKPSRLSDGCAMGCVAIVFAAPAIWIFWMVRKFLDGPGWFDFIGRLILNELIVAVGTFAIVVLITGIFAPSWAERMIDHAAAHMAQVVLIVFVALFGSLLLFIIGFAILSALGIAV